MLAVTMAAKTRTDPPASCRNCPRHQPFRPNNTGRPCGWSPPAWSVATPSGPALNAFAVKLRAQSQPALCRGRASPRARPFTPRAQLFVTTLSTDSSAERPRQDSVPSPLHALLQQNDRAHRFPVLTTVTGGPTTASSMHGVPPRELLQQQARKISPPAACTKSHPPQCVQIQSTKPQWKKRCPLSISNRNRRVAFGEHLPRRPPPLPREQSRPSRDAGPLAHLGTVTTRALSA